MFTHILLAVDGSEASLQAARQGTAVVVPQAEYGSKRNASAVGILQRVESAARDAGIAVTSVYAIHQEPHRAIVGEAKKQGCDLIVLRPPGPNRPPLICINIFGCSSATIAHGWTGTLGSAREHQMVTSYGDALHTIFNLQRALEKSFDSEWLRGSTTGIGTFPPINVFQQGDDFVALVELPGVPKDGIEIQAKESSIRLSGKKTINFQESASVHRRERVSGVFDRTITLPVQVDLGRLKAEYKDGVLALFIPRAESDKPRTIKIGQ